MLFKAVATFTLAISFVFCNFTSFVFEHGLHFAKLWTIHQLVAHHPTNMTRVV
jgi:hypothetical protein